MRVSRFHIMFDRPSCVPNLLVSWAWQVLAWPLPIFSSRGETRSKAGLCRLGTRASVQSLPGPARAFTRGQPWAIQPSRGIIRLFGWTLSTMGDRGASRYSHVHVMTRKHDLSRLIFWWRCTCYQLLSFGLINRFKEKDYLHDSQNVVKVSGDSSVRGLRCIRSYWYLIVRSKKGFCSSTQPPAKRIWSVKDILWLLSDHWCLALARAARGVRGTILSTETQPWQSSADPADHLLQTHKKMAAEAINYTLLCSAMYLPSPDANQAQNSN